MKFLLVDLSGVFWANWHATADMEVSEAFNRTVDKVARARDGFDRVAICCDAPPYKRKEILPTYKAQRDSPPPQAIEQLSRVKERLAADGCAVMEAQGYEADDVIAALVRQIVERKGFDETVVMSSDKDLLQLVDDDAEVKVLSPMSGKLYTKAQVIEKFGVDPRDMGDLLALMGDASDNVDGIPGVGEKTAAKLLHEWGSLEGALTHWQDIKQEKLSANIRDHGPAARLARQVVQLDAHAPVELAELLKEREQKPVTEKVEEYADSSEATDLAKVAPTTALATLPPSFDLALEPQTLAAAWGFAKGCFNSRLYSKFKTPEAIWITIVRGRELGLGAATALDVIHIVEGKPCLGAHLIIDRAKRHPDCEYFRMIESTDVSCTWECKSRSNPDVVRHTYTLEEAQQAGVAPQTLRAAPVLQQRYEKMVDVRNQWEKRPAEMIRKTCGVQLARIEFPGAALGLYAIEELSGE